jgi:hypothetical protein
MADDIVPKRLVSSVRNSPPDDASHRQRQMSAYQRVIYTNTYGKTPRPGGNKRRS